MSRFLSAKENMNGIRYNKQRTATIDHEKILTVGSGLAAFLNFFGCWSLYFSKLLAGTRRMSVQAITRTMNAICWFSSRLNLSNVKVSLAGGVSVPTSAENEYHMTLPMGGLSSDIFP